MAQSKEHVRYCMPGKTDVTHSLLAEKKRDFGRSCARREALVDYFFLNVSRASTKIGGINFFKISLTGVREGSAN